MTTTNYPLQQFVEAAITALRQFAGQRESRRMLDELSAALEFPGVTRSGRGSRLSACSHLDAALLVDSGQESLRHLIARFREIEPLLKWRRRPDHSGTASPNFPDGHANAMILGPGGMEERRDLWLGVTLMAPNVRYPDHDHAPEEVYLFVTDGEFRQGEGAWFTPGVGGTLYNTPYIRHAMRSGDSPLLAFWALLVDPSS